MPVIKVNYRDLIELMGMPEISSEKLIEKAPMIGCDVENFDGEHLYLEFFPNRPDLYSVEGIARALKAFFGKEPGYKNYHLQEADDEISIGESVQGVRDFLVACEVKNVKITDEMIQALMDLQEDLHWGLGRNRKKVAIGVHDSSKIKGPYRYTAVKPEEIDFVPLDFDYPMTPKKILEEHPKGTEYGHIIKKHDRYPVIFDSKGDVLSMPPIINGELTKVTKDTKEFFIDITGTDFTLINQALNILTTSFLERGFEVIKVNVKYPDKTLEVPDYSPETRSIKLDYINRMLGLNLGTKEAKDALEKMRFGVEANGKDLKIEVPPYRCDILHDMDLIEDVAIGYGYDNLPLILPQVLTTGKKHPLERMGEKLRQILIGYGLTEAMTLMLTNERDAFRDIDENNNRAVKIKNPISEEHTIVRTEIVPNLMGVLRTNKHRELPLKIFEIGDVNLVNQEEETGSEKIRKMGLVITHNKANYSEIKSLVEGILRDMNIEGYEIAPTEKPQYIPGRCAQVLIKDVQLGHFGEISPRTITDFELEYPVVAFEMDVSQILKT